MIWLESAILILLAVGILIAVGIGRKLERKLDACLNLFRALTSPQKISSVRGIGPQPPEEKTVFHLTPEHDAKVLGEADE